MEQAYSFSSDPRAVSTLHKKKKYREEEEEETANIMYDPRVIRGSTVVSRALSQVRIYIYTNYEAQTKTFFF